MKKLNEEEASFNGSLYYPKNLIFELKIISLEKINFHIFYIIILVITI